MRVFIGEFICGGGMRRRSVSEIDPCLQAEGGAMLAAIAIDVSQFADVSIAADTRICPSISNAMIHEMDIKLGLWGQWVRAAQGCDAAIVIAPESNGVLAKAVSMLRAGNVNVIASSSEFLRAASDKQHTARIFAEASVPHPETYIPNDPRSRSRLEIYRHFIVKPRDGCGTQQIMVFDDLERALVATTSSHVLQAFVPGRPISVASIVGPSESVILPAVSQEIALENCAYHGGCGPLPDGDQRRAASLAQRAIAALPSAPRGFVGFDLVLGDESGTDVVIEVNARLTTSYVGLRHMVWGNLAARLLGLENGSVQCKTNVNAVRWTPSGDIWVNGAVV